MRSVVEVRYFAGAADAVGRSCEEFVLDSNLTLGLLVSAIIDRHGPAVTEVLKVSAFLVADELTRDPATQIGARVDVLPPFAGG